MSTADRGSTDLQAIGREHFEVCSLLASRSSALNEPIAEAASRLRAGDLRRAAVGIAPASELLYASVDAHMTGKGRGFYSDYVFNCSIFVACVEHGIDELLVEQSGEAAASALEMMIMESLHAERFDFIMGEGGDMLEKLGDMLNVAFYKLLVRAFRILSLRHLSGLSDQRGSSLAATLDCEALAMDARALIPVARAQSGDNLERKQMIDQFETLVEMV